MKLLSIAALVAAVAAPAFAGDMYVVGSVGQAQFDINQSDYNHVLERNGVSVHSSSVDKNDTAYKLQFGYQFNPNFAVEGGYVDLGKGKYSARAGSGTANADMKASGVNIAAVGILPLTDSFSVFAKVGAIAAKVETTVNTRGAGGSFSGTNSSTKVRGNWGIGASYNLTKQLGVRLEAEQFSQLGDDSTTAKKFDVNMYSAGIQYKF